MDRIYVQTNDASRNEVVAFDRAADGSLTRLGHFETGGRGSGVPHLASQSSLALGGDRLLVTNAGSDDLSLFRVAIDGLELVARTASGGEAPTSVAVHGDLAYVLNNGTPGIAGFSLAGGSLVPLEGSVRPLAAEADPAQIAFSPDGRTLVVTERGTNTISTFAVDETGRGAGPETIASSGATPYGFDFTATARSSSPRRSAATVGAAAASSYALQRRPARAVSASVADTRSEVCWAAVSEGRPLRLRDELRRRHDLELRDRRRRRASSSPTRSPASTRARREGRARRGDHRATAASCTRSTPTRSGSSAGRSARTAALPDRRRRRPARRRSQGWRRADAASISRGFRGRRQDGPARPRPARPVPDGRLPGALGRPDAAHAARRVDVRDRAAASTRRALDLGRVPRAADARRSRSTSTASRSGRSSTRRWEGVSVDTLLDGGRARRRVRRSRSATAATRRTCRSRTSRTARPGSRSPTTASRSTPSTAARRGCSSRTSTSGRARSGCAASSCATRTSPASGRRYGYHNYGDPWREQRYWGD